ncbi:MAG: hypothetical protein HC846_04080 [Blastocatellia bacterium]|nr:hypothetical protein [Blastocatellia bacterium]
MENISDLAKQKYRHLPDGCRGVLPAATFVSLNSSLRKKNDGRQDAHLTAAGTDGVTSSAKF